MRLAAGDLHYPVPWSSSAEVSFVADAESYRCLLVAAGFKVVKQRSRRDFALEVFAQMKARGAAGAPVPLGLHIVMGASAGQKVKNMMGDITAGLIAQISMTPEPEIPDSGHSLAQTGFRKRESALDGWANGHDTCTQAVEFPIG